MDKERERSLHQSLGRPAEERPRSCSEWHQRGRVYHSHKSPIICVILPFFLCTFRGSWRILEKRSVPELPTQAAAASTPTSTRVSTREKNRATAPSLRRDLTEWSAFNQAAQLSAAAAALPRISQRGPGWVTWKVKTITQQINHIAVTAADFPQNKSWIRRWFISKQTYYGNTEQNSQVILKVAIGAVLHLPILTLTNETAFHVTEQS